MDWSRIILHPLSISLFALVVVFFTIDFVVKQDNKNIELSQNIPTRFEVVETHNFLNHDYKPNLQIVRDKKTLILYYYYNTGHNSGLTRCWECEE